MKLTKSQLRKIIKEELEDAMTEPAEVAGGGGAMSDEDKANKMYEEIRVVMWRIKNDFPEIAGDPEVDDALGLLSDTFEKHRGRHR